MSDSANQWITFFDHHAPLYLKKVFTRNTEAEVEFLLQELAVPPGGWILDVGCGVGRHAIPLAERGLRVVGIDISAGMLRQAQERANKARVKVDWIQADAARYGLGRRFDAGICLCEGSFGLHGSRDNPHEHELLILNNLHAVLRPGAMFILTALNGLAKIRGTSEEAVQEGTFDPLTLVEAFSLDYRSPDGPKSITGKERAFVPSELRLMLEVSGFEVLQIHGGTAGAWHRRPVRLDEIEIMVIARRRG